MAMIKTGFWIWALVVFLRGSAKADRFEVNLYKYLMDADRYEAAVRPTPHHKLTTNVTFGFLLHQVINVDEKNQQLTTSSWMNVNWMDQRLQWNHSEWGGVKILHIPNQKVWKPDLILTNNADPEYKESVVSTDVFVTPEGNVTWLFFAIYQSACQIRVRFYPFDDQECSLTFASWSYDGNNVNLLLLTEEGDLSNYVNSSEWAILSMTAHRRVLKFSVGTASWPVITITIHISRRPLFYVFNHIIPCVLISIMSMLGFYIPAETGEKVTMCITTLLSMGVFLKTITESMPPSSEAVPLIGMYYVVSLFIVCAATLVNVITLNVHNRGSRNTPQPVPNWARKYILGHMAKWICIAVHPSDAQMVHLAEKRRHLCNDDELLNEITMPNHNYVQTFGTPVILTSEDSNLSKSVRGTALTEGYLNLQQKRPSAILSHSKSAVECNTRVPSLVSSYHQPLSARASSAVDAGGSQRTHRSRSIYDYDYELKSLRKLNSQARLINGALTLMQAPLEAPASTDNDPSCEPPSYDNLARFDSLIGRNRLATYSGLDSLDKTTSEPAPLTRLRSQKRKENNKIDPVSMSYLHSSQHNEFEEPLNGVLKRELEDHFYRVLKKVYQTLQQNELRTMLQEERMQIMWEWKQVAIIVDRMLLLLFVLATGLTTFLILFERAIFEDHMPPKDDNVPPVI